MTAQHLIELALRQVGNTHPSPEEYSVALDHLNSIISNFAYWDDTVQPVRSVATLATELNLPPFYTEIFELLLAAREGMQYGIPMSNLQAYEAKAQQLTNRLVYRNLMASDLTINSTTMVV
jgi:hypothetical protein